MEKIASFEDINFIFDIFGFENLPKAFMKNDKIKLLSHKAINHFFKF